MIFNFSNDLFGDVMPFQSNWWLPWPKAGQDQVKMIVIETGLQAVFSVKRTVCTWFVHAPVVHRCIQQSWSRRTLLLFLLLFQPYNLKIRVVLDKASFGICEDSHWNVNHLKMRSESCSWHENLKDWSPLVFSQCNRHNQQSVGGEKRSSVFREISEKKNVDTEESDHRHKEGSWCNWSL